MVIKDSQVIDEPVKKPSRDGQSHNSDWPSMGAPADRVAAAVIDYLIVLMPFLYLVMAPFQRLSRQAALQDDSLMITLATGLGLFAVLSVILLYQTICIWLWGATVGKMFMRLRVQNIWGNQRISFMQSAHRALYWFFSCLFLGVPFLAIFSNLMRRPLHDRVSDTVVISQRRERGVGQPSLQESSLIRGVYWAIGSFVIVAFVTTLLSSISNWRKQNDLIADLEDQDILCAAVGDAQVEWPDERGGEAHRLSVAMALYAASTIDQKCLEAEVENLSFDDEQSALLNLTKSFVYADHRDLSDLYLEQVCEIKSDSDECRLSRVIEAVSQENWDEVMTNFKNMTASAPVYISVWAIRQLIHRENYTEAEEFSRRLPEIRAISDFILTSQAKIYWALDRHSEAIGLERAAYATMGDESKLDLSSYMCFEQIWADCKAVTSKSCEEFGALTNSVDESLASLKVSLAYLRKWECEQSGRKNYENLAAMPLHEDVRSLVAALESQGTDGFSDILDSPSADDEFLNEVSRRMVERTRDRALIKNIMTEWQRGRRTLSWHKLGETLFRRYYEMHEYVDSLKVADSMLADGSRKSKGIMEDTIVAAMRSGQMDRARRIFRSYAQIHPLPTYSAGRAPSSSSEFVEVVKKLMESDP